MSRKVVFFASAATAEYLVAGIPAAARALRELATALPGNDSPLDLVVVTANRWTPSPYCQVECARLAPDLSLRTATLGDVDAWPDSGGDPGGDPGARAGPVATWLSGEALVAGHPTACHPQDGLEGSRGPPGLREAQQLEILREAGRRIIAATGKPGDGIVSRHLNRPVSQAITRLALRIPGVTPSQASIGTALLGLAMAISLIFGGDPGLVIGALLFQAASIFDGVDGEIARATWRTSARGALLDSVIDAMTNLAFIAGLSINLARQGNLDAAGAGAAGLVMLATGLFLIGRRARASGGPFTFDVVKNHVRKRPSRLMQWLTWLTMRDFFAAAGALMIIAGFAHHALLGFAVATSLWLAFTFTVLIRTRPDTRPNAGVEVPDVALIARD